MTLLGLAIGALTLLVICGIAFFLARWVTAVTIVLPLVTAEREVQSVEQS